MSIWYNSKESRKKWLLWWLEKEQGNILWQEGYHGAEIRTKQFYETKERSIHLNPVGAGIVFEEKDYIYSSYPTCAGLTNEILSLADF